MKNRGLYIFIIAVLTVCVVLMAGLILSERDPGGWLEARNDAVKIVELCKTRKIYRSKYPYTEICYWVRKWSALFDLDRKLVYAVITRESEWNPGAKNVNYTTWGRTEDRGCMQVNQVWDSVIVSDAVMSRMFGGDTNRRRRVEEFIYDIRHNIFVGCYILRDRLTNNKTLRAGIIRYNGAGYYAELYADAVLDIYHDIARMY